jgi:TolB-like protein
MSGDRDQEYFSDGITEDLTSDLSRFPGLLVIARNSAFTYKSKLVKVQTVRLQDIFALQDEIVQQIIVNLKAKAFEAELTRVRRIPTLY